MSAFFTFIKYLTYPALSLVFPTKVINKEKMFHTQAIVCCNHLASEDVLLVASKLLKNSCNVVGKAELFKNKFTGAFLRKLGAISIERGEGDIEATKKILRVLKAGKQLLIFPEGTRNTSGTTVMGEFKEGTTMFAMKTNSPIIPLIIHHKAKPFKRNYLIVGDPIDLNAVFPEKTKENREQATIYLRQKMEELQKELDEWVTAKKKK